MALAGCKGTAWDLTDKIGLPKGTTIPLTPIAESGVVNNWNQGGFMGYNSVVPVNFDGEKDMGEMGPIRKYLIDHAALRLRSWQLYLDSDVCQALFSRSAIWAIGQGLRLQCKPKKRLLSKRGVELDSEYFNEDIEELFGTLAGNRICDFAKQRDLHAMATDAWINIRVGGDVLAINRLIDGKPKIELIDGSQIRTPSVGTTILGNEFVNPTTKNIIKNGIEQDNSGAHIAYWVVKTVDGQMLNDFERIEVRMSKFPYSQMACIIYGLKYRLANNRGIPLISAVMETVSKMGRYREAVLGGAEERAKITMSIEHEKGTGDEHPMLSQLAAAYGGLGTLQGQGDLPTDSFGAQLSNKVQATTNKQTVNMPEGAKLVALESKQEVDFGDFYQKNFDIVCAVVGYPPEVILSKYDSNYSASRAAIKDFEHTLLVQREAFANQFYQFFYNFCLDIWVLDGTVKADGYLKMLLQQDEMGLTAYRNAYWAGDNVPHIDPAKEVDAWRKKLGTNFDHVPLCTVEEATEALSGGDANSNMEQAGKELEKATEVGFKPVEKTQVTTSEKKDE